MNIELLVTYLTNSNQVSFNPFTYKTSSRLGILGAQIVFLFHTSNITITKSHISSIKFNEISEE